VPPGGRVEGADPDQPVDAVLDRQVPVGVLALHQHGHALDAGLVAGLDVGDVPLVAALLAETKVHPQQHLGPVLALGAAGPGVDRQDGVGAVVLAAEHLLELGGLDQGLKRPQRRLEVGADILAGLDPLHEDTGVALLGGELLQKLEVRFDPLATPLDLLDRRLVLPEALGPHLRLEPLQLGPRRVLSKIAANVRGPRCQLVESARKVLVQVRLLKRGKGDIPNLAGAPQV